MSDPFDCLVPIVQEKNIADIFDFVAKGQDVVLASLCQFKKEFLNYDVWYLWGGGYDGELATNFLADLLFEKEVYFVDKNPKRQGKSLYHNIKCISPSAIDMKANGVVIITTSEYAEEIKKDLETKMFPLPVVDEFIMILRFKYSVGHSNTKSIVINNINKLKERALNVEKLVYGERSKQVLFGYLARKYNPRYEYVDIIGMDGVYPAEIALRENDIAVCCGAFCGDIIESLKKYINGSKGRIYVFEINSVYYSHMEEIGIIPNDKVHVNNSILGNENRVLKANIPKKRKDECTYEELLGSEYIEIKSLDIFANLNYIEKDISFIKLNIQNGQKEALYGMEGIISKTRPRLSVTIYQWDKELMEIMEYLSSLVADYRFILRHHGRDDELVLYAY